MPVIRQKGTQPMDKHIGSRIRQRRLALQMSQEKLADAIGLTFQQVQKYEKGANRVGGSRMQQIADVLDVSPSFFFEGAGGRNGHDHSDPETERLDKFLATTDGQAICRLFPQIKNGKTRRSLVELMEQMVTTQK